MNFEWTNEALNSIRTIEIHISDVAGKEIGKTFTRKLFIRAKTLVDFPQRGRALPEFSDPHIREIFEGPYRIIYRIDSNIKPSSISVLGIVHSSQMLENTPFSDLFDE